MTFRISGGFLAFLGFALPLAPALSAQHTVTTFAAASLTEALLDLGQAFHRRHPAVRIRFNFAGSQQLATQLELGAGAQVFASADERWMTYAADRGLLADQPKVFARNSLVVIVPRENPGRLSSLRDLSRPGVKLVMAAETVPVGRYGRAMLANLARLPEFGPGFAEQVLGNVVSQEENVKSVLARVQLGEADAGIVYRTDVTPAVAGQLLTLEIPAQASVTASYSIALLRSGATSEAAGQFVGFVFSPEGQKILAAHGFLPGDGT